MSPLTCVLLAQQESFNARLKAEGDDNSTNLYISNLPKDINENVGGLAPKVLCELS